jgi:hypothetical protein
LLRDCRTLLAPGPGSRSCTGFAEVLASLFALT